MKISLVLIDTVVSFWNAISLTANTLRTYLSQIRTTFQRLARPNRQNEQIRGRGATEKVQAPLSKGQRTDSFGKEAARPYTILSCRDNFIILGKPKKANL